MNTSSDGAKFIAVREALCTHAYPDGKHEDGSLKYSLGFGSQRGLPRPGDTITIPDAFVRLRQDLGDRDVIIGKSLKVPVKQREWDAIASLFYQAGSEALRTVTSLFNSGKPTAAMIAFARFNRNQGVRDDGLSKRRIREMIMGIDGYYGNISAFLFIEGDRLLGQRSHVDFPESI